MESGAPAAIIQRRLPNFHEWQLIHHSISAQASARATAVAKVMNANPCMRTRRCCRSICRRSRSLMYGFSCTRVVSSRRT
jgi:hypothetical protein